jgi:hypothetical protein
MLLKNIFASYPSLHKIAAPESAVAAPKTSVAALLCQQALVFGRGWRVRCYSLVFMLAFL